MTRICKNCGLPEPEVFRDTYEVGGIGCAHELVEENSQFSDLTVLPGIHSLDQLGISMYQRYSVIAKGDVVLILIPDDDERLAHVVLNRLKAAMLP